MYRFLYFVILWMGLFHIFHSSSADESVCNVKVSLQRMVSAQASRTQIVATTERCWLFFRCTTSRSVIAYSTTYRQVTQYVMSRECCKGYVNINARDDTLQCIQIKDETIFTTTENPPLNQSLPSGDSLPNGTSSDPSLRIPKTASPSTTETWTGGSTIPSMTTPTNGTGRGDAGSFNMTSSNVPRGAVIMISIIIFFVTLIVLSIILGCVVYRRRKRQRINRKTDNLHMEPLRDLQLLSETNSHIQHFSPPSAPNDEYAIVEKKTKDPSPAEDSLQSYENTCIGGRPLANGSGGDGNTKLVINDVGKNQKRGETNRLTHTYMEGSVCLDTDEKTGTPVSITTVPDNCYNEIDETAVGKGTADECYTEVHDMPASPVCPKGGAQEYDYCYSKFDKSSPSANECYTEVDDMPRSCVSDERYTEVNDMPASSVRVPQEEYEAIGDVQLTYDHLDRGSTPGKSSDRETSFKDSNSSGGKYGVLAQSSSVDSPESYDTFQRSMSETDQSGIDGYEPLIAVPSSGSETAETVDADVYDGLDRAMPKTRRKCKDILHKLQPSTDTTAYGHLGSSFESDISEECSEKISDGNPTEPIYCNQGVYVTDRESTYTDMSGSRPNSVLTRSGSQQETIPEENYTEMAPTHVSNNYYNVEL